MCLVGAEPVQEDCRPSVVACLLLLEEEQSQNHRSHELQASACPEGACRFLEVRRSEPYPASKSCGSHRLQTPCLPEESLTGCTDRRAASPDPGSKTQAASDRACSNYLLTAGN